MDRQAELFGSTEFTAPDVLFKTTNVVAPKEKNYPDTCPSRGLVVGRTF